ncbi:MAG: hypothetical protein NT027_07455 [Proteobacteria bacterium]|nr:hypothetical protein [Pseudomonadota bacterium]
MLRDELNEEFSDFMALLQESEDFDDDFEDQFSRIFQLIDNL